MYLIYGLTRVRKYADLFGPAAYTYVKLFFKNKTSVNVYGMRHLEVESVFRHGKSLCRCRYVLHENGFVYSTMKINDSSWLIAAVAVIKRCWDVRY